MMLDVEDLRVDFVSRDLDNRVRVANALNGVTFGCARGEILALVGETGAGKSLSAYAIMRLLKSPARIVGGSIRFQGRELTSADEAEMRELRGSTISIVVQNAKASLDPLSRVGEQLVRVHRAHRGAGRAEARRRALDMMKAVAIPDHVRRFDAWPHELSGGTAQRAMIAAALINEPALLLADEPTTGLDVTVQIQILDLLRDLARARDMAMILITHDLGVVAHYCDRVAVMFCGVIVEMGSVRDVFARPEHPYTRALLAAASGDRGPGNRDRLGGAPPDLFNLPSGCLYAERCRYVVAECATRPPLRATSPGHVAACVRVPLAPTETAP
jgi:oligopeptide/dipeptide ABC transporter ATP-binding protein